MPFDIAILTRRRGDTETRRPSVHIPAASPRPRVPASPRLPRPRAFTLVEVLVSIVIALLLIVGISKIFGLAQQSSGAGTTLIKINDTTRTIQSVFKNDFQNIVTDPQVSPGFVISSNSVPAFRNVQDWQQGPDQLHPFIFPLPGETLNNYTLFPFSQAYAVNYRVHRTDRMCFFENGQFQRQTGDPRPNGDADIVTPASTNEAFVWIGHLALPNNPGVSNWDPNHPDRPPTGGDFWGPGSLVNANVGSGINGTNAGTNDNNQFASSWILGRCVIPLGTTTTPLPTSGAYFLDYPNPNLTTVPLSLMAHAGAPLSTSKGSAPGIPIYASRTDIMYDRGDPISTFRSVTTNLGNSNFSSDGYYWWEDLIGVAANRVGGAIEARGSGPACQPYFANPLPTKPSPALPTVYQQWTNNPSFWLSAAAAQTAPIFVRGCSQFIVEFAGDFAYQNPNGTVNLAMQRQGKTDGQIDYIVDQSDPNPTRWTKRIRWYGFPRDTASPNVPLGNLPGPPVPDGSLEQYDVIPVKWFVGNAMQFERSVPPQPSFQSGNNPMPFVQNVSPNLGPNVSPAYICAWGPDVPANLRPKLIRITIAIDEPTGRLNTEQTYEFIFALP